MLPSNYEKLVYTSLLGKIIGVYTGAPQEGWLKERICETYGQLDHYTHPEGTVPRIDDDISGPLTFIRTLEDSGLYENTPDDFFGKTWLNYIIPNRSIIWFGGMGISTEHTAFARLKEGIPSPRSGSMELNGKTIAEQIGGQIFIDCWGMVAPGNPALAARLAKQAASVSHDGEAVYAGQIQAAMVSAAFTEHDINKVLDIGISFVPATSTIAQVHRDVRAWVREDKNWHLTYDRIKATYGYDKYPGNCHVIPNHAIMVMAWAYGEGNFHKTMTIINTAGWDTDCNAGNVGAVSALICGLEHICDDYDYRTPFADRIFVSSAEATGCATDTLTQALYIARLGRRVMHEPELPAPKQGKKHHFEMEGALHGYLVDLKMRGGAHTANVPAPEGFLGTRCMQYSFKGRSRLSTAVSATLSHKASNYTCLATSALYAGMTVEAKGIATKSEDNATLALYAHTRYNFDDTAGIYTHSEPVTLKAGEPFTITWTIPDNFAKYNIETLGFETQGQGEVLIDYVDWKGTAHLKETVDDPDTQNITFHGTYGWISSMSRLIYGLHNTQRRVIYTQCDHNEGILIKGNRSWTDTTLQTTYKLHACDAGGIILRYQGLQRHYLVRFNRTSIDIVKKYYDEEILATAPIALEPDRFYDIKAEAKGDKITLTIDGKEILTVTDTTIPTGGAGFYCSCGMAAFIDYEITAETI